MEHKVTVPALLEWGAAFKAFAGGAKSGDRYLVKPFDGGVLLMVVDGLGHGELAREAATTAVEIAAESPSEHVISLVMRCDEALSRTRGAVMSLAAYREHDHTLTWIGAGNVEGVLMRAGHANHYLMPCRGVVGYNLSTLHAAVLRVTPGDTLIFATDGVARGFEDRLPLHLSPQRIADHILGRHALGTDDALALAARFRGGQP